MKLNYQKPQVRISVPEQDIITTSGSTADAEFGVDFGELWK